jgi:hypothetical protein
MLPTYLIDQSFDRQKDIQNVAIDSWNYDMNGLFPLFADILGAVME